MAKIQIPNEIIQSSSEAQIRRVGSNFSETIQCYLGNPITGEIKVTETDKVGLYFIFGLGSEPSSVFTATNDGLRKEDLYNGCPILVKRATNGYVIIRKNPDASPLFFEGTEARNSQEPVYISNFYYGTMHPYGTSLELLVIGAQYDEFDVVDIITPDFSTETVQDTLAANITLPTVNNTAKGILVQIDPSTETLSYKQSSTYAATIKPRQAYRAGLLPSVDTGLFRVGYFNLTYGVSTFTYGDIWSCPEFISSSAISAPVDATYIVQTPNSTLTNEQALSSLATGLLGVTTTTGVISTGGTTGGVDNAILRADGTGGKTVQSSGVTINDNGRIHIDLNVDSDALWIEQHSAQTIDPMIITDSVGNDQIRFLVDGGAIFNEEGNDVDFRIETDTNQNAFFVDGGNNNTGFGTGTPDAALLVDLVSTAKALGLMTMTTTERDAIPSPPNRSMIYNSTTHTIDARINGAWIALVGATTTQTLTNKTLDQLSVLPTTELTIASGAITITQGYHRIDTQGNAASDILDTINGGSEGDVLFLRAENDAREVILFHSTAANGIVTYNGENIHLLGTRQLQMLVHNGNGWQAHRAGIEYNDLTTLPSFSALTNASEFIVTDTVGETTSIISYQNLKVNLRTDILPQPIHSGFNLRWLANDKIAISGGAITKNTILLNSTTGTVLTMGTNADWIGGTSAEAASTWAHVYMDDANNLLLHDTMPNNSNPTANVYVAEMRVNQAGWNGTAGNGLNATSVVYDTDTGEGSIVAGMLLGVYSDSVYTLGRGKGSAATATLNNMSFALITAINTGTNTLTLEAGHNIALNDNDYLIVIENAPVLYRYESPTHYRWIGAMFNNASSNLDANRLHDFAYYQANEGADYSTTSATMGDIDGTSFNHNLIMVEGGRVDCALNGSYEHNVAGGRTWFGLLADGLQQFADDGLISFIGSDAASAPRPTNLSFAVPVPNLLPGTHNFKPQWKTSTATATVHAGAGTANRDSHATFSAHIIR